MKIKVSELHPNPFRNLEHYPIQPEKIEALKRSITDTTFWDNLLARPAAEGGYQIAYGHHRLAALRELGIEEVDIPVRELDNTTMAKIMANENMEEWASSAEVTHETVRAIIEAYGRNEITLAQPKRNACKLHFANLSSMDEKSHPYTRETLKEFLGWPMFRIEGALSAIELINKGVVDPDTFKDLSPKQAKVLSEQGNRAEKVAGKEKAREVVKELAEGMRTVTKTRTGNDGRERKVQSVTQDNIKAVADDMLGLSLDKLFRQPKKKGEPEIDKFAKDMLKALGASIAERKDKIEAVIRNREFMTAKSRGETAKWFLHWAGRFSEYATEFSKAVVVPEQPEPPKPPRIKKQPAAVVEEVA